MISLAWLASDNLANDSAALCNLRLPWNIPWTTESRLPPADSADGMNHDPQSMTTSTMPSGDGGAPGQQFNGPSASAAKATHTCVGAEGSGRGS